MSQNSTPSPAFIHRAVNEMISICNAAWSGGLMSGFSGNASVRCPDRPDAILITGAGCPKGRLRPEDCVLMNVAGEIVGAATARPSSESALHLAIYKKMPECKAILHTHPPYLQAVNLVLTGNAFTTTEHCGTLLRKEFFNVSLYEAEIWRQKLFFAPAVTPGGDALAQTAAAAMPEAIELPAAIWLGNHGLCALAKNLSDGLGITEEMEHLAKVRFLSRNTA